MEGCKDPFNRRTYPWGKEDRELVAHFRRLGQLRKETTALRRGDIQFFRSDEGKVGFTRCYAGQKLTVCINCGTEDWAVPAGKLLLGQNIRTIGGDTLTLAPMGFAVLEEENV